MYGVLNLQYKYGRSVQVIIPQRRTDGNYEGSQRNKDSGGHLTKIGKAKMRIPRFCTCCNSHLHFQK